MSFVILDGATYDVLTTGANESFNPIGTSKRTILGNLKSSIQGSKSTWTFSIGPLTESEFQTLILLNNLHKICDGDALNNVSKLCEINILGGSFMDRAGIDHLRIAAIRLEEA